MFAAQRQLILLGTPELWGEDRVGNVELVCLWHYLVVVMVWVYKAKQIRNHWSVQLNGIYLAAQTSGSWKCCINCL